MQAIAVLLKVTNNVNANTKVEFTAVLNALRLLTRVLPFVFEVSPARRLVSPHQSFSLLVRYRMIAMDSRGVCFGLVGFEHTYCTCSYSYVCLCVDAGTQSRVLCF